MKLSDIVGRVVIDPRKLTDYAVNPESPWGRHKAVAFERMLGFTRRNYADLLAQIEQQAPEAEATLHSEDEFGRRYTVDLLARGAGGERLLYVLTGSFLTEQTKPGWQRFIEEMRNDARSV